MNRFLVVCLLVFLALGCPVSAETSGESSGSSLERVSGPYIVFPLFPGQAFRETVDLNGHQTPISVEFVNEKDLGPTCVPHSWATAEEQSSCAKDDFMLLVRFPDPDSPGKSLEREMRLGQMLLVFRPNYQLYLYSFDADTKQALFDIVSTEAVLPEPSGEICEIIDGQKLCRIPAGPKWAIIANHVPETISVDHNAVLREGDSFSGAFDRDGERCSFKAAFVDSWGPSDCLPDPLQSENCPAISGKPRLQMEVDCPSLGKIDKELRFDFFGEGKSILNVMDGMYVEMQILPNGDYRFHVVNNFSNPQLAGPNLPSTPANKKDVSGKSIESSPQLAGNSGSLPQLGDPEKKTPLLLTGLAVFPNGQSVQPSQSAPTGGAVDEVGKADPLLNSNLPAGQSGETRLASRSAQAQENLRNVHGIDCTDWQEESRGSISCSTQVHGKLFGLFDVSFEVKTTTSSKAAVEPIAGNAGEVKVEKPFWSVLVFG